MNRDEIEFLRSLDKDGVDGTIQTFLLNPDLSRMPFVQVAKTLLTQLYKEKHHLVEDNIRLCKLIKQ